MTVDVDEQPMLAGQYKVGPFHLLIRFSAKVFGQVSSIPYVIAFKNGKPVNKFSRS